ncbi:MAG: rhodoquinone biosynthesis methyltransferase RquA [Gammaproteobacteria bacterium]
MKLLYPFWKHFADDLPDYLVRYYWWAYLWRPAIWFFDHQPVINAILFGQYKRLLNQTMKSLQDRPAGQFLQLTCVYGSLTPTLVKFLKDEPLYLVDVSTAQLKKSRSKLTDAEQHRLQTMQMNAEQLELDDNRFKTVVIFFLMHEMPKLARQRTLSETLRVLAPGGRLVITEYGAEPRSHWIYRFSPLRRLLLKYEPFLDEFWREDITALLESTAKTLDKNIQLQQEHKIFNGFYRVLVYQLL